MYVKSKMLGASSYWNFCRTYAIMQIQSEGIAVGGEVVAGAENHKYWGITREQWFQAVCFALCFLAFMLAEAAVNARAAVLLGPERVNAVYALGLVCTGLGFLSFALLRKLIRGEQGRKFAAFLAGALCVASAVLFLITNQTALFSLCAALCLLSCGHIGGCVYYNHAMTFQGSRCTGRVTGIGMGLAVLLQFLIQSVIPLDVIFLISMIGSIFLVVFLMSRAPRDWVLADPLPYSAENETPRRTALILLSAVALMSLVSGLIDGVITAFDSAGTYDIYHGVRLFYALGLILAGWAADLRPAEAEAAASGHGLCDPAVLCLHGAAVLPGGVLCGRGIDVCVQRFLCDFPDGPVLRLRPQDLPSGTVGGPWAGGPELRRGGGGAVHALAL